MRSFIALPVDEATTSILTNLQSGLPNVRWLMPDDLHITLAFLGDITNEQQRELDYQLDSLTLFELEILVDGLGAFERNGQTSTVWASVNPAKNCWIARSRCGEPVRQRRSTMMKRSFARILLWRAFQSERFHQCRAGSQSAGHWPSLTTGARALACIAQA